MNVIIISENCNIHKKIKSELPKDFLHLDYFENISNAIDWCYQNIIDILVIDCSSKNYLKKKDIRNNLENLRKYYDAEYGTSIQVYAINCKVKYNEIITNYIELDISYLQQEDFKKLFI